MAINSNITALKVLSSLNIDCQHAQQVGIQLFNPGATNTDLAQLGAEFSKICEEIKSGLQSLQTMIPSN